MPKVLHLEQAGPDWHAWRADGLGGSDVSAIMGDVAWTSPDELMEQKLGLRTQEENAKMARGKRLEPEARQLYMQQTGNEVRPVCVVHDEFPFLRASLDGLTLDGKLILEIKCPSYWSHRKALKGFTPEYYRSQLQHQLLVTGAERLHYFSYCPDDYRLMPEDHTGLVEVLPDEAYQERMFAKVRRFWAELCARKRAE